MSKNRKAQVNLSTNINIEISTDLNGNTLKRKYWNTCIKHKNHKKRKLVPANSFKLDDVNFFISKLQESHTYTKKRDLTSIFKGKFDVVKINAMLKYAERSRLIEVDYDGNIIWLKKDKIESASLCEVADFSNEFCEFLGSMRMNKDN